MTVLPLAAGLLDIFSRGRGFTRDRLPVGYPGGGERHIQIMLPLGPVHHDVQVQLSHAGKHDLSRLVIHFDLQGRVFEGVLIKDKPHLFQVVLFLGCHCDGDDGYGDFDRFKKDRMVGVGQGIAGRGLLQAGDGANIAGLDRLDLLPLVCVKSQDPPDSFLLSSCAVQDRLALLQPAGIDPQIAQPADKGVVHDLEYETAERFLLGTLYGALFSFFVPVEMGRYVYGRRQVIDYCVEKRLDAPILESRAAQNRQDAPLDRALSDYPLHIGNADLLAVQKTVHQVIVDLRELLHHRFPSLFEPAGEIGRHIPGQIFDTHTVDIVDYGLCRYKVDNAQKLIPGLNRDLEHHGVCL